MWITYKPADEDQQEWWIRFSQIGDREAEMIEARTGMDWNPWQEKVLHGNRKARRALLWTLLRRVHHTLRYEDVEFTDDQFEVAFDAQELGEMITNGEKVEADLDARGRAELSALRTLAETAKPAPGGQGKAPAPSGD